MSNTLIFIPTYNERENAPRMAREISALQLDADILFVDDNSPDGTGKLLDQLTSELPRLIVHHRQSKLGIGSAHSQAIKWAYSKGYKTLVTLDCDYTHSPSDISAMLSIAENYDMVVGSRWVKAHSLPGWNIYRRAMTISGHLLTKYILGIKEDASGAFRVYRLTAIPPTVFDLVKSTSYAFFFESLFIINRNGFKIGEYAISLPARTYGNSKMTLSMALRSACYVFELAFSNIRHPKETVLVFKDRYKGK